MQAMGVLKELMINGNKCTADFYLRPGDQIQFYLAKTAALYGVISQ